MAIGIAVDIFYLKRQHPAMKNFQVNALRHTCMKHFRPEELFAVSEHIELHFRVFRTDFFINADDCQSLRTIWS